MAYWTHRHPAFGGSDIQCQDSTTCVRRASVSASPSGRELTCTQLLLADLVCAQVPPKSRAGQCRPASSGCVLKPLFCSSALPRGLLLAGRQAERGAPQAARRGQLRASAVCRRGRPDGAPLPCPLPPPAQWHCQREGVPAVALRLPCLRAGGVAGGTPPPPPRPPPAAIPRIGSVRPAAGNLPDRAIEASSKRVDVDVLPPVWSCGQAREHGQRAHGGCRACR